MNGKIQSHYKAALLEIISLRSSRGRVVFFGISTLLIYLTPVSVLAGLSLWKRLDIPVPSIGLTRAYHYLLHGELGHAWQQNWLIYVVILIGLPLVAKDVYTVLMFITKRNGN